MPSRIQLRGNTSPSITLRHFFLTMRFKAKLAAEHVSTLYSLIVPISRLSSSGGGGDAGSSALMRNGCMLYLDNKFIRISIKGKSTDTDGIACFAELTAGGGIFLDHRIESAAPDNQIVMELDIVQLRMALQSIQQDKQHHHRQYGADVSSAALWEQQLHQHFTILKLAKRNNIPCLCIEAYTKSSSVGGGGIQVHHAIPVRICRPNEMQNHLPPAVALPDVQVEMQPDVPLRTVMERMRSISPTVYLNANMKGELTISMDSDGSSIRTIFSKLTPRLEDCKSGASGECRVKVDCKKLSACLQWQQQMGLVSSALLCLVENEALVLHALLNPADVGFFTYYIPVHFLSHDPRDDE
jgi:HUS1 checkpoint protein